MPGCPETRCGPPNERGGFAGFWQLALGLSAREPEGYPREESMALGLPTRLFPWIARGLSQSESTLAEAARLVLATAQKEKLPLAVIAAKEGAEHAALWFANNMLQIVVVHGRRPGNAESEALTKDLLGGLILDEDMGALRASGEKNPRFVDLCVTRKEIENYLRWARTVW